MEDDLKLTDPGSIQIYRYEGGRYRKVIDEGIHLQHEP